MSEWNERELCPDGGCTGVIGDDGTCKVCGKRGLAPARAAAAAHPDDSDDDSDYEDSDDSDDSDSDDSDSEDEHEDEHEYEHEHENSQPSGAGEWSERELCSNGACVGLLDDSGVCKVCGTKSPTWKPRVIRAPAPAPAPTEDAALRAAAADLASSVPAAAVDAIAPAPPADDSDDEPRALCPDGACVGVIGKDGTCKLCGKEPA